MTSLARALAIILGTIWFLPVSCTTGLFAGVPLVAKLHERHMDHGDEPYSLFHVVWQPGEKNQPFSYAKLDSLARAGPPGPGRAFVMTQASGRIDAGRSTVVTYKVLSSAAAEQLIEVTWADDTYGSVSRYRATPAGITPVFSRVESPDFMFKALLPAFAFSVVLLMLGRWLRRRVARPRNDTMK